MVKRHIHGNLITIYTTQILDTGIGYLSKTYNSQYFDPITKDPKGPTSYFNDEFVPLTKEGPWVLSKREISLKSFEDIDTSKKVYTFTNMNVL